jgi:hypothetical protein
MTAPQDHSEQDVRIRLELLVGRLANLLTPARDLVAVLRVRGNASAQTRAALEQLNQCTFLIWKELEQVAEQIRELGAHDADV